MVAGSGFTPQNFGYSALSGVVGLEPLQAVSTPIVAAIDYPNGCHVVVTGDRLEVRRESPDGPEDPLLASLTARCLELWPLVRPTALGINFVLRQVYDGGFTPESAHGAFLNLRHIEEAFGMLPTASQHAFQLAVEGWKVTLKTAGEAQFPEGPGLGVDCNVHRDAPDDVVALLGDRRAWFERCRDWSERLVGYHNR